MKSKSGQVAIIVIIFICLLLIFAPATYIYFKNYVPRKANLPQYETVIKTPQFRVNSIEDSLVPFQNNIPFSSYERKEKHAYLNLAGIWKKERTECDHRLTLLKRTPDIIKRLEEESQERFQKNYDDSSWLDKEIPGMENQPPDRYQGCVWYRREVDIPKDHKGKFIKLVFEGANYFTDVWVNGQWIGAHEGGYTPFSFDITDYVECGASNTLAVRVDNIPWLPMRIMSEEDEQVNDKNIVPYKTCDWWNAGGITRDIYLEVIPNLNIVRADVKTKIFDEQKAELLVEAVLYNHSGKKQNFNLELTVFDTKIDESNILSMNTKDITDFDKVIASAKEEAISLSAYETKSIRFTMPVDNIELWHPDNPHLYSLAVTISKRNKAIDEFYTQFGIREVKIDSQKAQLLLNGKPIFLRGLARHEVFAGASDGEVYEGIKGIYKDMLIMKEINANLLRTTHYPQHPATYILSDRVGLLIWSEIPVFWFGSDEFDLQRLERKIAKQMWLEMIYRDYNRPSVIFWSSCNECGAEKERSLYLKDMHEAAYLVDGTRLVVQSAAGADTKDATHLECDLIGITSYYGIFYGSDYYTDTSRALDELHAFIPDRPILLTEFGVWSEVDLSNAWNQVEVIQDTYEAASQKPFICGVVYWCAFNWHTMITDPQTMGLITLDRETFKPSYFALQRIYGKYIGNLKLSLTGPEYTAKLQGNVDFSYSITDDKDLKDIILLLDNEVFQKPPIDKKDNTITIDTTKLKEGKHTLLVKAIQKDGLVIANNYEFFVDNIDEFPVISLNIKDEDYVFDNKIVIAKVEDDRGIKDVLFRADNQDYSRMKSTGFDYYIADFDASKLGDGSTHTVWIKAIDSGDNETLSKVRLKIDKEPAIAVSLPLNNDWVSYETNAKDADDLYNFPAEFLPKSNSWYIHNGKEPVKFKFASKEDGQNNNMECRGQLIKVPPGKYKKIYILGVMHNGNEVHYASLNYKGAASVRMSMPFSDWWVGNANFGEEIVFPIPYHHEVGAKKKPRVGIYMQTIDCDPDEVLEAISFPTNAKVHIFAITLKK